MSKIPEEKIPNLKYSFPTQDILKISWLPVENYVYQISKCEITNSNLSKVDKKNMNFSIMYEGSDSHVLENNVSPGTYLFRLRIKKPKDHFWSIAYKEIMAQIDYSSMSEKQINAELNQLIRENDYRKLESFLSRFVSQINVDRTNEYGKTMLMDAAQSGSAEVVKILIKYGANVNTSTKSGKTALFFAINSLSIDSVKYLLECNYIDLDYKDSSGSTALMHCAEVSSMKNSYEIIKMLIKRGADITLCDMDGMNALDHLAAYIKGGSVDVAKLLIENGLKPYEPLQESSTNDNDLYENAVKEDQLNIKSLNSRGIGRKKHINCSKSKKSTLFSAALNGHTNLCQYLINECNCDPFQTNSNGYNAKDFATFSGFEDTAKYFQMLYDSKILSDSNALKTMTKNPDLSVQKI